jgi:hypothetical protein
MSVYVVFSLFDSFIDCFVSNVFVDLWNVADLPNHRHAIYGTHGAALALVM